MVSKCLQGGPAQQNVPTHQTQACAFINKTHFDFGLLGCLWTPRLLLVLRASSVYPGSRSSPQCGSPNRRALSSSGGATVEDKRFDGPDLGLGKD